MNDNVPSEIIDKFQAKCDWIRQRADFGEPIEPGIYRTLDGGWQCNYSDWCAIVIRPGETEPHEIHGGIGKRWYREWGAFDISGKRGSLGHPISDVEAYDGDGDSDDRISHFENGDIIWTAKANETRVVNIKDKKRWYKAKHDQLLDLLRRAVEAVDVKRHSEALKAVDAKCREDQFDVVLLGEFQCGKSTTLDTLCGGREMSPQGIGTKPTSAVPVSVQSLGRDESEEWGEIQFKSKRELAGELFDTFDRELYQSDSGHSLLKFLVKDDNANDGVDESKSKRKIRDRFCDGFDFDNPEHLEAARSALQSEWDYWRQNNENKSRYPSRKLQLMEVETLVVRFYGTREYSAMLENTRCGVSEIRDYVRFPSDWNTKRTEGFSYDVTLDRARFAFVKKAVLHLRSSFLDEDNDYRMTDCPGLDASAYDTQITRNALINADGILFVHRSDKTTGNSTNETLLELVKNLDRENKTVMALNIRCSRDRALRPLFDEDGEEHPSLVSDIEKKMRDGGYDFPVVWCHTLFAYLAAMGERRLKTNTEFSPVERLRLAGKAGLRDDNLKIFDDGRPDSDLWIAAISNVNKIFNARELDRLSGLDSDSVAAVRKASNIDEVMKAIAETVLREKAESILVDNGSKKAFAILDEHEHELELKVEAATQSAKQCQAEVDAAKLELEEYKKEAEALIQKSYFARSKDQEIASLARALTDDILSGQFFESVSRKLAKIVFRLNSERTGFSQSGFKQRFHDETGPLVAEAYAERGLAKLEKWKNSPEGRWKSFLGSVEELNGDLLKLGSRHFSGNPLFKGVPVPRIDDAIQREVLSQEVGDPIADCLDAVVEELREGFFSGLLSAFKWLVSLGGRLFGKSDEEIISENMEKIRPDIEKSFRDTNVRLKLEEGVQPIFKSVYAQYFDHIAKVKAAYREKILTRCDEQMELHRKSDEELKRIAEEKSKLLDERIKPLRDKIAAFEKTVKTAIAVKG